MSPLSVCGRRFKCTAQLGAPQRPPRAAYVVPGQMIGERAFVLKENAIADAVVLSDLAYFLVLEHANVLDILGEDPEVLGRMKILVREREFQLKAQAITAKKA